MHDRAFAVSRGHAQITHPYAYRTRLCRASVAAHIGGYLHSGRGRAPSNARIGTSWLPRREGHRPARVGLNYLEAFPQP